MPKFMSISDFHDWESNEFGKLNWIRDRVSALIGIPTILAAASYGAAQGSVIGAGYVGIGILSGTVLGAIIGGTICFTLAGIFAVWIFPALITLGLKISRRITEGNFKYRYINHLAASQVSVEYEKMISIAEAFHELESYKFVDFHQDKQDLLLGLTDLEKQLFTAIYDIYASSPTPEVTLKTNMTVAKYLSRLKTETAREIRLNKKWAKLILSTEGNTEEDITLAYLTLNTIDEGRGPLHVLDIFFGYLSNNGSLFRKPESVSQSLIDNLKYYPYVLITNRKKLVKGLLELEQSEIKSLPEKVQAEVAYYMKKTVTELDSEISAVKPERPWQKAFFQDMRNQVASLLEKKNQVLQTFDPVKLNEYQQMQKAKLRHNRYNKFKTHKIEIKLAQVEHALKLCGQ